MGYGQLDDLQILNLGNTQWISSTYSPSMNNVRSMHGCIVANDQLWAIGGYYEDSVEAIEITSITTETWQEIGSFSCELSRSGITAVEDVIFIVGGLCWDISTTSSVVYTIDTTTNSLSIYSESLSTDVGSMPIMMIDSIIYGFGGRRYNNGYEEYLDSWTTLKLLRVHFLTLQM